MSIDALDTGNSKSLKNLETPNNKFASIQRKSNGQLEGATGGRLSVWVHKLERININPNSDDANNNNNHHNQHHQQQQQQQQQSNHFVSNNQNQITVPDGEEFCLKVLSLVTELVLILFAVCLLLIASVVIISKKVPSFMESYEIVPMVLFILCIVLAAYSFVRWLATKLMRLSGHQNRNQYQSQQLITSNQPLQQRHQQQQQQQQRQNNNQPTLDSNSRTTKTTNQNQSSRPKSSSIDYFIEMTDKNNRGSQVISAFATNNEIINKMIVDHQLKNQEITYESYEKNRSQNQWFNA